MRHGAAWCYDGPMKGGLQVTAIAASLLGAAGCVPSTTLGIRGGQFPENRSVVFIQGIGVTEGKVIGGVGLQHDERLSETVAVRAAGALARASGQFVGGLELELAWRPDMGPPLQPVFVAGAEWLLPTLFGGNVGLLIGWPMGELEPYLGARLNLVPTRDVVSPFLHFGGGLVWRLRRDGPGPVLGLDLWAIAARQGNITGVPFGALTWVGVTY